MQNGLTRPAPDALALEYKRDYGTARGNLNIADLVNDPTANGECRVLGLSLPKQGLSLLGGDLRSLLQDFTDTLLVTQDRVHLILTSKSHSPLLTKEGGFGAEQEPGP